MTAPLASPRPASWLTGEHLFWPADRWQQLQRQALADHLRHARTTPFYRDRLAGLPPDAPLTAFPLTTKDDLAAAGPAVFGTPSADVREWVCTSGTSGKPLHVPLTGEDLERLAANETVALGLAGVSRGDAFLMAVGLDRLFVAGLAYWLGAQRLGAACVRAGPQAMTQADAIAEILDRVGPGYIVAVPSFLRSVSGLEAIRGRIKGIIAIGEPVRDAALEPNALGRHLRDTFGCPVLSTYASTEACTTFAESPHCAGGHLNPQMAAVEILDDAGRPILPGQVGEVVLTPLGVRGFPLVRFRTGDVAALYTDPCPCGRTTPRLGPIVGRRQQLLKIRGTSVYPPMILDALQALPEVQDCAIVAEEEDALSDVVTLFVYLRRDTPEVRGAVEVRLRALLRVLPRVIYCDAARLRHLQSAPGSRKPQRFLDRR